MEDETNYIPEEELSNENSPQQPVRPTKKNNIDPSKTANRVGTGMQAAGKTAKAAGTGMEYTGKAAKYAGKGLSSAGNAMTDAGASLSSTGLGAIAGVPLAALGVLTSGAGKATEVAGTATEAAGKATKQAGDTLDKAGKNVKKSGSSLPKGKKVIKSNEKPEKNNLLLPAIGCSATSFLIIFCIFISLFLLLGIFNDESGSGSSGYGTVTECKFNLHSTSLSKSEFKEKVTAYANKNSNFKKFADAADDIYEYAQSKNVNPELVIVRAKAEGNGAATGASNNYWGINCTNESQGKACTRYSTFEQGYEGFINILSKKSSLEELMSTYAYIGQYWFTLDTPNPSGDGGCYYAKYIYPDNMPSRVQNACSSGAPSCVINGNKSNCTKTTDEDQQAYATWQIKTNMAGIREEIFGLKYDEGGCESVTSAVNPSISGTMNNIAFDAYSIKYSTLKPLNRGLSTEEINDINNTVNKAVSEATYGTGAAVAEAGETLVDWFFQRGLYLSYWFGGGHMDDTSLMGANPKWGTKSHGKDSKGREYYGLDCSGFVSWAIRMGCNPNYGTKSTSLMVSAHTKVESIEDAKPGDLMLKNGHVRLVVKNNGDGTVIVAEELGTINGGLVLTKQKASPSYKFIDMSSYYSNQCNKVRQ